MKEENSIKIEFKDSGNFLRITPIGLNFPNAELDWDRNWLTANIEFYSGSFHGAFQGDFMTVDFEIFKQELRQLYKSLTGTANFNCDDRYVMIKMEGDGLGHLLTNCQLSDDGGISRKIEFKLQLDQTQLPDLINSLNNLTKEFPIRGNFQIKNEY